MCVHDKQIIKGRQLRLVRWTAFTSKKFSHCAVHSVLAAFSLFCYNIIDPVVPSSSSWVQGPLKLTPEPCQVPAQTDLEEQELEHSIIRFCLCYILRHP